MSESVQAPRGSRSTVLWAALALVLGLVIGVVLTTGVSLIAGWLFDDSRSRITISDVVGDTVSGFSDAHEPSGDACGDRRGCVEGVKGVGASIYRFRSLDLARQAVVYSNADFYRSDRLVVEFEPGMTADERYRLIQVLEGTWTGSDD